MDGMNSESGKGPRLARAGVNGRGRQSAEMRSSLCTSVLRDRARAIIATLEQFEALSRPWLAADHAQIGK